MRGSEVEGIRQEAGLWYFDSAGPTITASLRMEISHSELLIDECLTSFLEEVSLKRSGG